jgi:hypothetical protein
MRTDLLYALRTLRKSPGFTVIAVLALGLGIGANTAIFSLVNAVLIRPLAYKDPGRLVAVFEGIPRALIKEIPFSPPDFESYRKMTGALADMAAYQNKSYELSGAGDPERIMGARVSASFFSVLGVQPAVGRAFTNEEDTASRLVAVLNHGFWRRKFGADPSIIGKPVILDRQPYTVIGIMPSGFEFPSRGPASNNTPADIYVPISFTPVELARIRDDVQPQRDRAAEAWCISRPGEFGSRDARAASCRGSVSAGVPKDRIHRHRNCWSVP